MAADSTKEMEVADFLVQVAKSSKPTSSILFAGATSTSSAVEKDEPLKGNSGEAGVVDADDIKVDVENVKVATAIEAKRKKRAEKKAVQLSKGAKLDLSSLTKMQAVALLDALTEKNLLSKVEISIIDQIEEKTRLDDEEEELDSQHLPSHDSSQSSQRQPTTIDNADRIDNSVNVKTAFEQFPYQLCQPSESKPNYIWVLDEARRFFKQNAYWPSFVGSRIDYELEEKGALPVLVWPEQTQRINIKKNSRKRSREDNGGHIDSSENERESDSIMDEMSTVSREGKRLKTNHVSFMSRMVNTFRWLLGFKIDHKNKLDQGNASDDSIISDAKIANAEGSIACIEPVSFHNTPIDHVDNAVELYANDLNVLRQNVFYNLNEKGFFVGPADIYGADYSIYVGDPSKGHSVGTVRLVPPKLEYKKHEHGKGEGTIIKKHTVTARDILSYSRVQNHVAKMAIYVFDDTQLADNSTTKGINEEANKDSQNIQVRLLPAAWTSNV